MFYEETTKYALKVFVVFKETENISSLKYFTFIKYNKLCIIIAKSKNRGIGNHFG